MCLFDQCFKCRKIGLGKIFLRSDGIEFMAECFRTAVGREMLGTACREHILAVALKSLYEGHAETGRKIRIFSVGLMASSPSRVTEDIDVRAPECKSLIDVPVALFARSIVLGTGFGRDNLRDFSEKFFVKHSRQADRLREHGRRSRTGNTMETFVPPVICRNTETIDGRCAIA